MWRFGWAVMWVGLGCSEQGVSTLQVPAVAPGPAIDVRPSTLDYGVLGDGDTSVLQFEVTNVGKETLEVTGIALQGSDTFALLDSELEFQLDPAGVRAFDVAFSPLNEAFNGGVARVYSNDPARGQVDVLLRGFTENPPPYEEDDCEGDEALDWSPAELVVAAWNPSVATGTVWVSATGWYAIYDKALAESGPSQTNESGYLRVSNGGNPEGRPLFGNCEGWWVVVDDDNDGSGPVDPVYLGTFWLEAGDNDVALHHYCTLYRAGYCESFHNDSPEKGTCESNNWNSIHLIGEGVCLSIQEGL